jgi:phosphohistidine phosphatase
MKTLYLARHGKAEKEFAHITDFDRPLTNRGIRDAELMGRTLKLRGDAPAAFISSPAIRALSTAYIFAREMEHPFENIQVNDQIYEASTNDLLSAIRQSPQEAASVILFGHNPAFTDIVGVLTPRTLDNVPTSGVVCIEFETQAWSDIKPGTGKLRSFDTPKGLVK